MPKELNGFIDHALNDLSDQVLSYKFPTRKSSHAGAGMEHGKYRAVKEAWEWSEMTVHYWMMVEGYPNLKEEVGGSIPAMKSPLYMTETYQVVTCLLCFDVGLSAFYLKQKVKKIGSVRRTGPSRMKM